MQKIYNIISGKKPLYTFITFSLSYTILLGILYLFSSMPLLSKTEFMNTNALNTNNEFKGLDKSLLKQSSLLKTAKNSLNNKMGLFLNDQEIEKFYEEISNLSLKKQMTMKSLIRGETILIDDKKNNSTVEQYKVSVSYELEGSFSNYLSIRKDLTNLEKVIIFEEEKIIRSGNKGIIATGTISVPRMVFKGE